MNLLPILLFALSIETFRAETTVRHAITSAPPYIVDGPLVSVVTITYNEEKYLPDLLASISNQTYQNIEVIVSDGLSTDSTVRIAHEAGAIVAIEPEYNLSKARNTGTRAAHGDILIFIDADTVPEQIAIERVMIAIDNGAEMVLINRCCTDSYFQSILRVAGGWLPAIGYHYSSANGQFIAVTKQAYDSIGGFDETCLPQEGHGEDVDFIKRISERFPVARLRTVYAGTSGRRQKKEGYIVPQHWQARSIRG